MTQRVFVDRSRIEDFQRCPRKRYLTYHQGGRGIVPVKTPLPLAVGGSVHVGLAVLLQRGQSRWDKFNALAFDTKDIEWKTQIEDEAVRVALADFQQYTQAGLELDAFERAQMGPAQASGAASGAATSAGTFEDQLVAQARALGMNDAEVAQYEAALRQNRAAGAGGTEGFEKYLEAEQSALVEALVRAYARRRLRPLLEQFEVLEVEREGEWKLSDWSSPEHGPYAGEDQYELWFMSRPDALLRERATNQLYLLSYKTTGAWDVRKARDAEHDMQGLSEGVEVERRLAGWWQKLHAKQDSYKKLFELLEVRSDWMDKFISELTEHGLQGASYPIAKFLNTLPAPPRILAVRYEYLLKGERWKDKDLAARFGFEYARVQKSILLRQYVAVSLPKRGEAAFNLGDTCWSYDYVKEDGTAGSLYYGHWKAQAVFEVAIGGSLATLQHMEAKVGMNTWNPSPIKAWIDALDASAEAMSGYDPTVGLPPRPLGWKGPAQALGYTAEHPLDTVFVPPITVTRNDDDLRDLFESVEAQERSVAEAAAQVHAATDASERRSLMNQHFPMYRRSCEYPSECVFVKVCYAANTDQRENPLASGAFRERVPNHPQEMGQ